MSNPVIWKNKKNITDLSSAELAQRVVKVKSDCLSKEWTLHWCSSHNELIQCNNYDPQQVNQSIMSVQLDIKGAGYTW